MVWKFKVLPKNANLGAVIMSLQFRILWSIVASIASIGFFITNLPISGWMLLATASGVWIAIAYEYKYEPELLNQHLIMNNNAT